MNDDRLPKHSRIFADLRHDIEQGRWRPGERVPSEAELTRRFDVSRITVSRAVRDLQRAGLVERHPGSGTFVRVSQATGTKSFGLLIPDLGDTEIFEPICRGMMASPLAHRHALLWGNSAVGEAADGPEKSGSARASHLCRQYIERGVAGVFFAPVERVPAKDELNRKISGALQKARIPIVLLDRPLLPFPAPSSHDLVGIDNRCAGFVVTEHLLRLGCRHVQFLGAQGAASTVDDREAGFREALYAWQMPPARDHIHRAREDDIDDVVRQMTSAGADSVVCANDRLAGTLMHGLRRAGRRVPQDVRLVGIDDVEYARLLPVPLTTLRQPTRQIGETALAMMLERIAQPDLPVRDVRLQCKLVVRESCGAAAG